jgi:hypothetical protein
MMPLKFTAKKCSTHESESLKFFCQTHDALICQNCLLENHLGEGHEVVSSERVLQGEVLKGELARCQEYLEQHRQMVLTYK